MIWERQIVYIDIKNRFGVADKKLSEDEKIRNNAEKVLATGEHVPLGKNTFTESCLAENFVDILCLTEQWLDKNEMHTYRVRSYSASSQFYCGGTVILIKDPLNFLMMRNVMLLIL